MTQRTCPHCREPLPPDAHWRRKFCSDSCGWRYRYRNGPPCSVAGCDGIATQRGMCQTHYSRAQRGADVTAPLKRRRPWGQTCEVPGCAEPNKESGLCGSHAARLRTHGDVLADVPLRKLGPRGQGSIDSNGYRSVAGRKQHRVVMEANLGRQLRDDETVHHINGDRLDNRPENLELWIVRRQPPGQRVADRVADAIEILERYAPEALAPRDVQLIAVA